jgi:hypothetical protein
MSIDVKAVRDRALHYLTPTLRHRSGLHFSNYSSLLTAERRL